MMKGAIILAGGAGRRFWPFGEVRNKCAMPVANVPNVRRLADSLYTVGVRRIVVVLGAYPHSVRAALAGCAAEVAYVEQPAGGGTAGAALAGIQALDDERFLLLYGDIVLTEEDLRAVAASQGPAALIDEMPAGEGSLWISPEIEEFRLVGARGHSSDATHRLLGVFALDRTFIPPLEANPGVFRRVDVGGMPPLEPDLMQSLNDWDAEVAVVPVRQFAIDMDKPWHALDANRRMCSYLTDRLTENKVEGVIHDGAEIHGFVQLGKHSVIGRRTVVEGNLIVGEGTTIDNGPILKGAAVIGDFTRISDYSLLDAVSVVGSRCVLGHGAEMGGVMLDGSYLYHYCEISGLVGESVDIGAATVCGTLRFDDAPAEHNVQGRRERPAFGANASYFGDYSRTGVNVITMPGAKIGAYACVGAGILVYEDVPSRTLRLLKQETVDRPWGPERYGW